MERGIGDGGEDGPVGDLGPVLIGDALGGENGGAVVGAVGRDGVVLAAKGTGANGLPLDGPERAVEAGAGQRASIGPQQVEGRSTCGLLEGLSEPMERLPELFGYRSGHLQAALDVFDLPGRPVKRFRQIRQGIFVGAFVGAFIGLFGGTFVSVLFPVSRVELSDQPELTRFDRLPSALVEISLVEISFAKG